MFSLVYLVCWQINLFDLIWYENHLLLTQYTSVLGSREGHGNENHNQSLPSRRDKSIPASCNQIENRSRPVPHNIQSFPTPDHSRPALYSQALSERNMQRRVSEICKASCSIKKIAAAHRQYTRSCRLLSVHKRDFAQISWLYKRILLENV